MLEMIKIVVGSCSEIKVNAAREAIEREFNNNNNNNNNSSNNVNVDVVGIAAVSNVSDNPIGLNETRQGCINRLNDAVKKAKEQDSLKLLSSSSSSSLDNNNLIIICIAVENGIVEVTPNEIWMDVAVISAAMLNSKYEIIKSVQSTSNGIFFPYSVVEELQRNKGNPEKNTIGKIICPNTHQDPHFHLSGIHRSEYLSDGIYFAIRQLKHTLTTL